MRLLRWLAGLWAGRGRDRRGSNPPPPVRIEKGPVENYGDRAFRVITNGTAERDHYVIRLSGRAGLRQVEMRPNEPLEEFGLRLLYELIDADVIFEVMGGLLIPDEIEDSEWSPAVAAATALHLRRCQGEAKERINSHIAKFLEDFFGREMGSIVTSRIASGRPHPERAHRRTASANGAA